MFSTQSEKFYPPFVNIFDIISLFAADFEDPKIGISGKGLKCRSPLHLGVTAEVDQDAQKVQSDL